MTKAAPLFRGMKGKKAMNKKTGSVLVLIIITAALVYSYGMFNSEDASEMMPAINGDVTMVAEEPEANDPHAGMTDEEHARAHAEDDHSGHSHEEMIKDQNAPITEALTNLNEPSPLTIHPALGVRAIGNPDAPVKVTEIFSLTCGHCANFHNTTYPLIKENFVDTGKVYYVYQEFPFNAPALHASMIARCLPQERYAGFIDILFKTQAQWTEAVDYKEALRQNAKLAGMNDEEFDACLENKDLQQALAGVINEASQKWSIRSTPSLVINDGEKVITGAQPYKPVEYVLNQFISRANALSQASTEPEPSDATGSEY